MTKRERIERKREQYRRQMLDVIRNGGNDYPEVWGIIGITESEYNSGEYEIEGEAASLAAHDVRWAITLCGWKVYGVEKWDRICGIGERAVPGVKRRRPSRKEWEYKGGFGSPIDWDAILAHRQEGEE